MSDTHQTVTVGSGEKTDGISSAILAFAKDIPREVSDHVSTLFWRMLTLLLIVMFLLTGGASYYFSSRINDMEIQISEKNRAIESINRRHRDLVRAIGKGDIQGLSKANIKSDSNNEISE